MIYTQRIQSAIAFAIRTHEIHQKQLRKGKNTSYISHPLSVGLILSQVGASEDVIMAGILHDTIEDSIDEHKVTPEMIGLEFGDAVTRLVASVTEFDKSLSWLERKHEALLHIKQFNHDSLLLKSADVIANNAELITDFQEIGDSVFDRFNAPKQQKIRSILDVISTILETWKANPLSDDLNVQATFFTEIK